MCFLGIVLGQSGYPDQAGKSIGHAIACARRSGHLYSLVCALILGGCGGRIFMKDVAGADRAIAEMVPLAEEHGLMGYLVYAPVPIGWVKGQRGQLVDAIAMMRRGMGQIVAARVLHVHTCYLAQFAALESAAGQPDAAPATVQQALAAVDAAGECWAQAELRRVQGEITASATPPRLDEAERCMRTAIDIARAAPRCSSCAPRRAWRSCCATGSAARRRATCWRRSIGGTPRASSRPICKRRRRCSTAWPDRPSARHDESSEKSQVSSW